VFWVALDADVGEAEAMTAHETTPHPTSSSFLLEGRRIAVTGATGGIGRALVRRLIEEGAAVAATGTSPDSLAELQAQSPTAFVRRADITVEAEVEEFFAASQDAMGSLDAIVNLAGLSVHGQVVDTDVESFHRIMAVNVLGTFLSCKHGLSRLNDEGGLIVNVGSLAGVRPNATAPLYCTSKAAVAMFSDALALQVKERGIRVTNVTPGGVDSPFWGERPVNRATLMASDDVVDVILFVLSRPAHVVIHNVSFESTGRVRG